MSSYSSMTDNPLVEAVARAVYDAQDPHTADPIGHTIHMSDYDAYELGTTDQQIANVMLTCQSAATAALRAIEDAGWKVVPVEATTEMVKLACKEIENADMDNCEPDDPRYFWGFSWQTSARTAYRAMLDAAPSPTSAPTHAD